MAFALVVAGAVVQTGPIPTTWRRSNGQTISNFDRLPPAQWIAEGWLPLTEVRPALGANQMWGDPPVYAITPGVSVTATYPVVAVPAPQQNAATLLAKVLTARAANKTAADALAAWKVANPSPSPAQVAAILPSVLDALVAYSAQLNSLIDMFLTDLTDITGT